MCFTFRLSSIFVVLTLFSCTESTPSQPVCRVASATPTHTTHSETAAACIIKVQNEALLIHHRVSNRLDFPGGKQEGSETLACTAHRKAWETTGFNVEVGDKLAVTPHGVALFGCELNAGIESLPASFAPPQWAKLAVIAVVKTDPFLLQHDDLRYPDELIPFLNGFTALSPSNTRRHHE